MGRGGGRKPSAEETSGSVKAAAGVVCALIPMFSHLYSNAIHKGQRQLCILDYEPKARHQETQILHI